MNEQQAQILKDNIIIWDLWKKDRSIPQSHHNQTNEIFKVHEQIFGKVDTSCTGCMIQALTRIYKHYDAHIHTTVQ
jgi:hypothetical protein